MITRRQCIPICVALLLAGSSVASATPITDYFHGQCLSGVVSEVDQEPPWYNTGYNNGHFYYYPNSGWYAQWYYDHPYDDTRWKEIEIDVTITGQNDTYGSVAVNWSKPAWSLKVPHPTTPPLPGTFPGSQENTYIARQIIVDNMYLPHLEPQNIQMRVTVPDYNPEWVSIDFRGVTGGTYLFYGTITHECVVPEPATVALLALGGLMLLPRWRPAKIQFVK